MLRYIVLSMLVVFLAAYAWRDWYKSLCGLVVMMAVIGHESMPKAMFGIIGLNPSNLLFVSIFFSWLVSKRREQRQWDMPSIINKLFFIYIFVVLVALFRYAMNIDMVLEFSNMLVFPFPTVMEVFADNFLNSIKWVLPGIMLYTGCNSKERFKWGVVSLLIMYLILAILVIRWMPLGLLVDGDALQRRAARVLDREIGYYRTNLAVMLAGAFWMIIAAKSYFSNKYSLFIYGCAGAVLLAMLLTGGRGGYLAWAVVGLIVSFARYKKYIFLVPPAVILVLSFVPSVQERIMMGIGDSAETEYSTDATGNYDDSNLGTISAGRTLVWPLVLDRALEAPFIGYGFSGITTSGVSLETFELYRHVYRHPHNAYLQTLIDNGILGSIPILFFFFLVVKYSWILFKDPRSGTYVLAGGAAFSIVVAFLVASLTGQSFYPEERSFGMWCAIGLMLRVYVERSKLDNQINKKLVKTETKESSPIIWESK